MSSKVKAYALGVGVIVLLACVGYFLYTYYQGQKETTALQTQVSVGKVETEDLKATLEIATQGQAITEQVITEHAQKDVKIFQDFDFLAKETEVLEQVITQQSGTTPAEQDRAVSEVRIAALWTSYCLAAPAAAGCKD